MKRRAIDPEESALWHHATRDVARHRGARRIAAETAAAPTEKISVVPAKSPGQAGGGIKNEGSPRIPGSHFRGNDEVGKSLHGAVPGLDRRNALRLKRGQMPIEARLDLHGMIQAEAHRALAGFVARSHAAGRRVLLVITGKGTRDGEGVLRAAVPRWLAEPALRPLVLATAPAVPRDGGAGALYVLLRRER
jgi:DNA-nicking Smr family endonuclease